MKMQHAVIAALMILAVVAGVWAVSAALAKEERVSLQDVPYAVRATIEKYAAGGEITEIERAETRDGVVYEAEVQVNGGEIDILVSGTGEYLGTEGEEGEGDEDEDDADVNDDDDVDEDEDEQAIAWDELPATVRAQLEGVQARDMTAEVEDGFLTYEVEYIDNGAQVAATFTESGDIIETEETITTTDLPPAVAARIQQSFPDAVIGEAELVVLTFYEVELNVGGHERELKLFANGQLLDDDDEDEDDGHDDDD